MHKPIAWDKALILFSIVLISGFGKDPSVSLKVWKMSLPDSCASYHDFPGVALPAWAATLQWPC